MPNGLSKALSITCEGIKASELVELGQYDWVSDQIGDSMFPIEEHRPVVREIELVEFGYAVTSEEALTEFADRGLERPTYEDGLVFGVARPEELNLGHPVVFLHEQAQGVSCHLVLVLGKFGDERSLHLDWFGRRWSGVCRFAGVRK